ncbi:MAG: kinesin motor protein cin8 [Thelocarpon superellum]|nr:MAG: kinesin motor protein cin8 [Thelocarpon superellum]
MPAHSRRNAALPALKTSTSTRAQRTRDTRPSLTRTQTLAASSSIYGRSRHGNASSPRPVSRSTSRTRTPSRKLRDSDASSSEETNIRVVVRCRGRSDREVRENSGVVLSTDGLRGKTVELTMGPSALGNKTYTFDNVFSPAADQYMIYDDVVKPMLHEMLAGYNCTIFAYGQTGTGKTYTMSGDMSDTLGLVSDAAGIIPRVLDSLFSTLEADGAESSVKVSFIELYNEELRDLLSAEENNKLKIYEETGKKGHGATLVQGMEESHIKTAIEGVKLLGDGSHKRQVAATKCNDLSSRSHTVFTITAYIKRTNEDGEEYVSAGKLNLVDLAGSENIQRSGAENKRAAEAGLINKSLLTLGRVINALVDRGSHIPYRESKLTRILQDSLGGRTKTCIIATVSPAKSNLEETISTLDYAFRAKNIRNKPQVNQLISKKTVLREYTEEIQKLKSELIATRQRNGVYLTSEDFEQLTGENESRRILSEEQRTKLEMMDHNLRNKVQELFAMTTNYTALKKDNDETRVVLDNTETRLHHTEAVLTTTRNELAEQTAMKEAHQRTEEQLADIGEKLVATVDQTVADLGGLQHKLDRNAELHAEHRDVWTHSQERVSDVTTALESRLRGFRALQDTLLADMSVKMCAFVKEEYDELTTKTNALDAHRLAWENGESEMVGQSEASRERLDDVLDEIRTVREDVKQRIAEGLNGLSVAAARISAEVMHELDDFKAQLHQSYGTLGEEFRCTFESLMERVHTQRHEAEGLRSALDAASAAAMDANAAASARLDQVLIDERQQAARERAQLLSQIGALINASGEAQDSRVTSKIGAIQDEVSTATTTFKTAHSRFGRGMDDWAEQEDSLAAAAHLSRQTVESQLQRCWATADEQHSSIQATTAAIHAETVRLVDAQTADVGVQMSALDAHVARAKAEVEGRHQAQRELVARVGAGVSRSYVDVGDVNGATYDRLNVMCAHVKEHAAAIERSLGPLEPDMCQRLADLRGEVGTAPLREYVPTGSTPPRRQFYCPSALPRTNPRVVSGAGQKRAASPLSSPTGRTPSGPSVVFSDEEGAAAPLAPSPEENPGLREVDVNVEGARSTSGDSAVSLPSHLEELAPPLKRQRRGDPRATARAAGRGRPELREGGGRIASAYP